MENRRGLHLGCGSGEDTFLIASLLSENNTLNGIDEDTVLIEMALQRTALSGMENVRFSQVTFADWNPDRSYDFVYTRIQATSLPVSEDWLADISRILTTGGLVFAEVIKPSGFRVYPYNHAFARTMELIGQLEEAQSYEGTQLPGLLQQAGFSDIETHYASPAFIPHSCNHIASLSLECYQSEILYPEHSNKEEINALLQELRVYEQQEDTLVSRPGVLQISAKKN